MRFVRKKCKNQPLIFNESIQKFVEAVETSESNEPKCCHQVDSSESTLIMSPKTTMVHPPLTTGYCSICKGFFTFIKDDKGIWNLKTDE